MFTDLGLGYCGSRVGRCARILVLYLATPCVADHNSFNCRFSAGTARVKRSRRFEALFVSPAAAERWLGLADLHERRGVYVANSCYQHPAASGTVWHSTRPKHSPASVAMFNFQVCFALLQAGADKTLRDGNGETSRHLAECRDRGKISRLLSDWRPIGLTATQTQKIKESRGEGPMR